MVIPSFVSVFTGIEPLLISQVILPFLYSNSFTGLASWLNLTKSIPLPIGSVTIHALAFISIILTIVLNIFTSLLVSAALYAVNPQSLASHSAPVPLNSHPLHLTSVLPKYTAYVLTPESLIEFATASAPSWVWQLVSLPLPVILDPLWQINSLLVLFFSEEPTPNVGFPSVRRITFLLAISLTLSSVRRFLANISPASIFVPPSACKPLIAEQKLSSFSVFTPEASVHFWIVVAPLISENWEPLNLTIATFLSALLATKLLINVWAALLAELIRSPSILPEQSITSTAAASAVIAVFSIFSVVLTVRLTSKTFSSSVADIVLSTFTLPSSYDCSVPPDSSLGSSSKSKAPVPSSTS